MKVAKIKTTVVGNRLVFKLDGTVKEVAFDKLEGIDEKLKQLNLQRYFLRKNKRNATSSMMGKRFN